MAANRNDRIFQQLRTPQSGPQATSLSYFTSFDVQDQELWERLINAGAQFGVAQNIRLIRDYFLKLTSGGNVTYNDIYNRYLRPSEIPSTIVITKEQEGLWVSHQANLDVSDIKTNMRKIAINNANYVMKVLNPQSVKDEDLQASIDNPTTVDKLVNILTKIHENVPEERGQKYDYLARFADFNDDDWKILRAHAEKSQSDENINFLQDYFKMVRGEDSEKTRRYLYENYIISTGKNVTVNIDDTVDSVLKENEGQDLDKTRQVDAMREAAKNIASLVISNVRPKASKLKEELIAVSPEASSKPSHRKGTKKQ